MDIAFQIANLFALLCWLALFLFPKNKQALQVLSYGCITVLCLLYLFLIAPSLLHFGPDTFSSLENIRALFISDRALTAGWVHYLAFDLFVGIHIVRESLSMGMPRWKYTLCLPFAFLFGPLGLVLFYIFKWSLHGSDRLA